MWGLLIFSCTACFAIQKDPSKQRKPINTNNVANLLTQLTKSVTTYNDSKYDLSAHKLSTNLFWDNASNYRIRKRGKLLKGLDSVKGALQTTYPNCQLKDKEILGILFYSNWKLDITDEIMNSLPESQWPKQKDQTEGCLKLTKCIAGKSESNMNWSCDEIIRNAYIQWYNKQAREFILEESNLWSEKYYNGTLDDSTYDILYDMQQITKTIYDDPKTVTSVVFYKNPNFMWNIKRSEETTTIPWTTTPDTPRKPGTPWGENTPEQPWTTPEWDTPWNQNNPENPNNEPWWTIWWQQNVTEDDEINSFINDDEPTKTVTSEWNTAYINNCVTIWSKKLDEFYLEAEEEAKEENNGDPTQITEEEIDEIYDEIMKGETELRNTPNQPLPQWNQKKSDDVPATKGASSDPKTITKLRQELQSCVDKCDGLRVDEKAVCKAQCLCTEYSSKALFDEEDATFRFLEEGALRIRICTIPSKTKIISTTTRNIYSIEWIIATIHDTIKALFESWELTPKVQKEEMLDTSLSDIKLKDMISLTLGMKFQKPVVERERKESDAAAIKSWLDLNLWIKENQNFFNVLADNTPPKTSEETTVSKAWDSPETPNISIDRTDIKLNQYAGIYDSVSKFLETNNTFLEALDTNFQSMTEIFNSLPEAE